MASTSTKPFGLHVNMILEPVMRSEDYVGITPIAYFPDGQRMISGSREKTSRQWNLQSGKEIEEARGVCKGMIMAVAVSRDGRWVVTGGGNDTTGELKACEVETGTVKTFKGHSSMINCIDVSTDSKLLASGSIDHTARIWNLETGKLVAGPFKSVDFVGAVRFSTDSKKLAINSDVGMCLEIWDVQKQKLDVRKGKSTGGFSFAPIFWTNKNKNILAAFSFTDDDPETIYEFDASTLETVGTPFKGHTDAVTGLALLFDGALLASASRDNTIKLWAFEPRQLLASFYAPGVRFLIPSPDSLQLAFTDYGDPKIYICNATSALRAIPEIQSTLLKTDTTLRRLLESDATRRPTVVRRTPAKSPVISFPPRHQRPSPTLDHQQPMFLRHVHKLFHFTSRTTPVPPVQHGRPRDLWDFPATSPLPPNISSSAPDTNHSNDFESSSPPRRSNRVTQLLRQGLSLHRSESRPEPQVVEVAAGRKVKHLVAANLPEYRKVDDTRHPSRQQTVVPQDDPSSDVDSLPDVHWFKAFFCYYSCWSHGRLRAPPRWRLERVDLPR